jgi:hypothetical protein
LSDPVPGHQAIKGAKAPGLHFMISKNHAANPALPGKLDKAINELNREGKITGAMNRFTSSESASK